MMNRRLIKKKGLESQIRVHYLSKVLRVKNDIIHLS